MFPATSTWQQLMSVHLPSLEVVYNMLYHTLLESWLFNIEPYACYKGFTALCCITCFGVSGVQLEQKLPDK